MALAYDIQRMRRLGATLGENGARALAAVYDETLAAQYAPEQVAESFIQIYNATLNGRRLSEAAARKAAELPDYIRLAAEDSAQRDLARASRKLKRPKLSKQEWRQVQSAQVQKYAGMEEDGIPETGFVFAHNKFYLIHNYGLGAFEVTMRLDPAQKQHTVNRIMEEVDHGYDGQFGRIGRTVDGEHQGDEGGRSGCGADTGD